MMREDLDDYLSRVIVGRRERGRITIADYNEAWPNWFNEHRARIAAAIGQTAHRIEHIGSTSVAGLAAKPVIDVLVAVLDVDNEDCYLPRLASSGYALRIREPGHRMLRTPDAGAHIHIWPMGSDAVRRQLLFRDWLRHSREDQEAYEALKRQLAKQDWEDRSYYTEAKTTLVVNILQHAEAWAVNIGWSEDSLALDHGDQPPHMTRGTSLAAGLIRPCACGSPHFDGTGGSQRRPSRSRTN
jgi:GrpB-like predicted nucleotidyltransferase (UPF0157 family)